MLSIHALMSYARCSLSFFSRSAFFLNQIAFKSFTIFSCPSTKFA